MGIAKRVLGGLAIVLVLATVWIVNRADTYPDYTPTAFSNDGIKNPSALFLGTSSLLFTDGETQWCLDCFVSRPPMVRVAFSTVKPDVGQIDLVMNRAFDQMSVPHRLAGVAVAHSHYDHSMDGPELIKKFGGQLVGSPSTLNIGLGQGLPEQSLFRLDPSQSWEAGQFRLTGYRSAHAPTGFTGGLNSKPLEVPAHALRFMEGISYAFAVWHASQPDRPICLIQPSAGFVKGQFDQVRSDVVFLGVGGLGKLSDDYIEAYWQETVIKPKAKKVYLIHWDDFTKPLVANGTAVPLVPMPVLFDDYGKSQKKLLTLSKRDGVPVIVADAFQRVSLGENY